jgi:thiol-disulfide isomerase/thioredoxin
MSFLSLLKLHQPRAKAPALLCLILVVALGLCSESRTHASAAPDLALTDLQGKSHSLADYRGKIVVLNFWATWCGPCREEMPMLSNLAPKYDEKYVTFLAASLDDAETQPKIPDFLTKKKITLATFTGATPETLKQFHLGEIIPATLIFDRDGTSAFRIMGEASKKDISSRLDWLLSERSHKKPKELIKNY